jgi:integrase
LPPESTSVRARSRWITRAPVRVADLVGHRTTIVTQKVYRHQLRPMTSKGAMTMKTIFTKKEGDRSA